MKIPQQSNVVSGQLTADTTDPTTKLVTDVLLAAGGANLLMQLDQRALDGAGTWKAKLRYRFLKARADQPGTWNTSTTERTTADSFVETIDISGTTDRMFVQVALAGYEAGGEAECFAQRGGQVDGKGVLLGRHVYEMEPIANSGQSLYVPFPQIFPTGGLTKLMFAWIFTGVGGTITYRPAWRQYKFNRDIAGSWTDLGSADSTVAADGTDNSGSLTATPTSGYSLGQGGLKLSGDARGRIETILAGIY